jgi:hypothetical protein
MIRTALLAAAVLVATAAPASATETNHLIWDSDPGAWPTQGASGDWTAPDPFSVWQHPDLKVRVKATGPRNEYMQIDLARHDGQRITEGSYVDQRVLVLYGGFVHTDNGAEFTVDHLAYGPDGNISEFEGSVEHHGSDQPGSTFRAKISYRR